MHKKYHEKFKILEILAVTTQAHEGIETDQMLISPRLPCEHPVPVPGKKKMYKSEKTNNYKGLCIRHTFVKKE